MRRLRFGGQSMIEYLVLLVIVAIVSIAFVPKIPRLFTGYVASAKGQMQ
ncbi:MAG: hypothetical protein AABZ36_08340 [Nitrospirota bacterium]